MTSLRCFPENNLAEKLRRDNCDQFNVLVRMHLSFVLDFNTEEGLMSDKNKFKKWPFYKKVKNGTKAIMEGAPLTQEGICLVYQLIEFLKKESNITVEGIFRRTGSLARQQDLKNLLNQGSTLCLEGSNFSVHDCASVLKSFLAELPEPLLTDAHFPAYCQLAELCGDFEKPSQEVRLLRALQLLLLLLSPENRALLKDVLDLLHLTASYEHSNKMSASSLATLFTPHLLCPRTLSPENLHTNSQNLTKILAFMIKKSPELFDIPPKLAVDIRAYYNEKEKKKMSPKRDINESVCDTAKTVYSFVDHEKTAKENQSNPTETALAHLYAHIQSLPESSKKRKLIKQFNKENGQGVPLQVLRCGPPNGHKSVGNSIKKFKSLAKAIKINGFGAQRSSSEELLNTFNPVPRTRLFCTNCSGSSDVSNDDEKHLISNKPNVTSHRRSKSDLDLSSCDGYVITSTPAARYLCACVDVAPFTPSFENNRHSISPITRSAQRMTKTMQETMMTPRSRKPVVLVSRTNLTNLPKLKKGVYHMDSMEELMETKSNHEEARSTLRRSKSASSLHEKEEIVYSLSENFKEYLCRRSILIDDPMNIDKLSPSKMSSSLLQFLDGKEPESDVDDDNYEKELVLRPRQFDENGQPTVYETSF